MDSSAEDETTTTTTTTPPPSTTTTSSSSKNEEKDDNDNDKEKESNNNDDDEDNTGDETNTTIRRIKIPDSENPDEGNTLKFFKNTIMGARLTGFPPVVQAIQYDSPLSGLLEVGQTVLSVEIPGLPISNLKSGGFTADNVTKMLREHRDTPNKYVTVQIPSDDGVLVKTNDDKKKTTTTNLLFDGADGGFNMWSIGRIFGMDKKKKGKKKRKKKKKKNEQTHARTRPKK